MMSDKARLRGQGRVVSFAWKSWDVLHWGIIGIIAESSLRISEELDGPLGFSVWTWGEIIWVTGWISKPKNYCMHLLMCISACCLFMSILSLFVFEKTVDGHVSLSDTLVARKKKSGKLTRKSLPISSIRDHCAWRKRRCNCELEFAEG